ncbi:acetyl-CoA carboxylase carboxyltransferase subunit alpha [Stappia taiwanensis]|uniref:Acetyl-coenzyme A carboxylase carboxyl transferase subunit alpha n=1 Tax=Stappia taiwanensis TaxID=992267 RepID=A0A838XJC5_9HYPH|nr:acetyl-CoA carboxylase carboxyltransferase subunit alpha [Stappia taiwanensis]MBA4611429.1 acetyl-CoA carboxylase carboxyltransferase subunit alpha [Stappia taiwanensis]GGF00397.1 acetyl-coenzyme A carboxylase carboxyl transferase subunit alpha [Stappia taiwanensis]
MLSFLDFEKPVADLQGKVHELKAVAGSGETVEVSQEIARLEQKAEQTLKELYAKLTPWQKTQVARHPDRPHAVDYITGLIEDFTPLSGDRSYAEDAAIIAGIGRFRGRSVAILGQEKGADTQSRLKRNFGMARPEGYRKAVRIMDMAERFSLPVVSLVDTAGAYPGIGAEERGQAEAIARSTDAGLGLSTASVALIIGEGGSGGAIAIATANHVAMLEHSIYSVISPEAGASILWRDSARAQDAATNMKITAQDLIGMRVIDEIVEEPLGGAHRAKEIVVDRAGTAIEAALARFDGMSAEEIRAQRRAKFLEIGRTL